MITHFTATIEKFAKNGEKTGWTYIVVPLDIAEKLMPGNRKGFRVKGFLDDIPFDFIGLLPIGEGNLIMALNAALRRKIKKQKGEKVQVEMEVDTQEKPLSPELMECTKDDPDAFKFFNSLAKSHQRYFSNWIESAKTHETKTKRIAQAVNALSLQMDYGEMIRAAKRSS